VMSTETAGHRHAGIPRLQAGEDVNEIAETTENFQGIVTCHSPVAAIVCCGVRV
jgi:hypothetical protein